MLRLLEALLKRRVEDSTEFNLFRKQYHTLSFEEQKRINTQWNSKFPNQKHYDLHFFLTCFQHIATEIGENISVAELGGNNGQLAFDVLSIFPRMKWLNIEIINLDQVDGLKDFNYSFYELPAQIWNTDFRLSGFDLFVSSHTFEHLSNDDMDNFLFFLLGQNVRYLIFETPLKEHGQDWHDYHGSHVLKYGRGYIRRILKKKYELIKEDVGEKSFLKWCSFWRGLNLSVF